MTDLVFLQEASKKYNLEFYKVIHCLKIAIAKSKNYGEISDELKNNKFYFYESFYNRFGEKRRRAIKITRYTYQKILNSFIDNLIELSNEERLKNLKTKAIHQNGIVKGRITQVKDNGLVVATEFGYGFVPKNFLFIKDIKSGLYQEGKTMFFHIKKYRKFGSKIKITLNRTHNEVDLAEAQHILSDCGVYATQRTFGKEVKVYCSKKPDKEQMKALAKQLNEKIIIELRR